jgi:hypothetical protein
MCANDTSQSALFLFSGRCLKQDGAMIDGGQSLKESKDEVRAGVDDLTETLQKAASALLFAHGGAMLACLSQLKDYDTNPHLKHIGLLIGAFAAGFILAALGYIDVALGRAKLMLGTFNADPTAFKPMPLNRAASFLYLSVGILLLAILGVAWRFIWL